MTSLVIVGATGTVGKAVRDGLWPFLAHTQCPVERVRFYASEKSVGTPLRIPHRMERVQAAFGACMLHPYDHVVLCTPKNVTKAYLEQAIAADCATIIDTSNASFDGDSLVVDGLSEEDMRAYPGVFSTMSDSSVAEVAEQVVNVLTMRMRLVRADERAWHIRRLHEGPSAYRW